MLFFGSFFVRLFGYLAKFFAPLGQFLFKYLLLPLYGKYLMAKSKLSRIAPKRQDRFFFIFTNHFIVNIIILTIGCGVAWSNISAYESKEDYGQNALVYKLAGISDLEIIQDTNNIINDSKVYNYQDPSLFISGNNLTENDNSDADTIYTDEATTQGDLALIKPDIVTTGGSTSGQAPAKASLINEYTVLDGDTISSIGRKFGVSVNTILWANNLSFSSYVKPGQKILVPSVSGVVYKVAKGDTLGRIASNFGVSESTIRQANAISGDNISVGANLLIPGGRIIETAKPRTVATVKNQTPRAPTKDLSDQTPVTGTGKMVWPDGCYRISQYFKGWLHTGLDIACPWGTPLKAADSGRVSRVQYGTTGYGYNVIIDHGNGIQTLYGHMSSIDVSVGEYVDKGEVIGKEGSTGRSTGPHVHFEVRVHGTQVNPLSYIR